MLTYVKQGFLIAEKSGREDPIGVENLRGSGMIAGAMSRAYDEIVTVSLVSKNNGSFNQPQKCTFFDVYNLQGGSGRCG